MCEAVAGFEDIHSNEPYIDAWVDGDVAFVDLIYVPPSMRNSGIGKKVFNDWLAQIEPTVKRIKLKACTLGGMDGVKFWTSLGFVMAYSGDLCHEVENTMTLGVNGYSNPVQEFIESSDADRHWIEGEEDDAHYELNPQVFLN